MQSILRDVRYGFRSLAKGLGITFGLGLAAAIGQATSVILFEVQPRDPQVFAGVVAVLTITGMLACLLPARRATRVDPLTALRSQ
jgi:putative ABC transport system permease protein